MVVKALIRSRRLTDIIQRETHWRRKIRVDEKIWNNRRRFINYYRNKALDNREYRRDRLPRAKIFFFSPSLPRCRWRYFRRHYLRRSREVLRLISHCSSTQRAHIYRWKIIKWFLFLRGYPIFGNTEGQTRTTVIKPFFLDKKKCAILG